jgi:hypothetical protein
MRKRVRALHLNRETLRNLTAAPLRAARGGGIDPIDPNSQEGTSCIQSCFFNTCYETCPWPTSPQTVQAAQ